MLEPKYTNEFLKCLKRDKNRGLDMTLLNEVMNKLVNEEILDEKYRDHALGGNYIGKRECHIKPNWLLVYRSENNKIIFYRTGTHSDLFE